MKVKDILNMVMMWLVCAFAGIGMGYIILLLCGYALVLQ
jgi:hypothetical protein